MVLRRNQRVVVEEVERPSPEPGWVLVKVRACGVCGTDLHVARFAEEQQRAAAAVGRRAWERIDLDRGVVMGHEWCAEVVEAGSGADQWTPGTRVTFLPDPALPGLPRSGEGPGMSSRYPGAYGEYMVVRSERIQRVPEQLPDQIVATTEPCAVGLHAVREARLATDECALVIGAGPIGMMTLLWLKHDGVEHVAVSDFSPQRRALAARCGADLVLDPGADDVAGRMGAASGGLPQVVFECVGVTGTIQQAMDLVAPRGRVIVVGACMTEDRFIPGTGMSKHLTVQFSPLYTQDEVIETLNALASGKIDTSPLITRTVGLDELPAAFSALSEPSECKVMLALR
jgi:2-desacetyl-2-hydroxyethyl bacteriochlorophyllide A dehydrogenase